MSRFLRQVHIERYGALRDFDLGPLGSGLNVVYGPNEAGKSTIASFIGGVLFGWEQAEGVRNTYRTTEGERAGMLVFAQHDQDLASGETAVSQGAIVSRGQDESGLQGDTSVVSDIDGATYRAMFWLTSDELQSLRNASDVTERLLAVGAATNSSPSVAYARVTKRIEEMVAPTGDDSIRALVGELETNNEKISSAMEDLALVKQQDRERRELVEGQAVAAAHLDEATERVQSLRIARVRLSALNAQISTRESELSSLKAEKTQAVAELDAEHAESGVGEELIALDAPTERVLRDSIDDLAEEQSKAARAVELARENAAASSAAYEALLEIDGDSASDFQTRTARRIRTVTAIALPLAFIAASLPVFAYGRETRSFSFTVFGVGLVVLAALLAAGALAVLLRPDKRSELLEERRKNAQWVMVQDRKKLEACLDAKEKADSKMAAFLRRSGLGEAGFSARHAIALLDDAREARSRLGLANQRISSISMRIDAGQKELEELCRERAELLESLGLPSDGELRRIDALLHETEMSRDALSASLDDMNQRFSQIDKRLDQEISDRTLDALKLDCQQVRSRLRERKRELVTLLLARRLLEKSIVAWESRSQPEVYAQASRLFAELTNGAWRRISMTGEGRLVAVNADEELRDVRHLSLGTRQQLYLALRVAMLMQASAVGRDIAVIADDILVNFDAERRIGAARVLAQLARRRQVVVFTCHRETVQAFRSAALGFTFLQLG